MTMANAHTAPPNPGNILLGTSGSMMVIPPSNTTTSYILTVINSGWSNSCTTSVIASAIVVPPPGGGWWIVTGPGGWGGGTLSTITHPIDSCLGGDFSGNSFDGICHSIAHTMWRPISGNISTDIINTLHTSVTLNRLISDLEREDWDTLSNNQVQHTYAIALGIWREISTKKDTTTIQETINTLKNIRNTTKTIKTKIALDTIVRILEQFMKNWVNEFRLNPSMDITRNTNISESSDMDNSEYTTTTTFGTPKYVQAERSVTFRKTEYVWLYNILDYLSRNTEVTLISEGMNWWTRVLYNWLEWYIKSVYLRDGNDADILRSGRTVADYHPQWYINVAQSAYVRSLPEANARIISVVYRDDIVRILDSTPGWYEILSDNGVHGYIRKELVNTMDTTF